MKGDGVTLAEKEKIDNEIIILLSQYDGVRKKLIELELIQSMCNILRGRVIKSYDLYFLVKVDVLEKQEEEEGKEN